MSCTIKIKNPSLRAFLNVKKDFSYNSFADFKQAFLNRLSDEKINVIPFKEDGKLVFKEITKTPTSIKLKVKNGEKENDVTVTSENVLDFIFQDFALDQNEITNTVENIIQSLQGLNQTNKIISTLKDLQNFLAATDYKGKDIDRLNELIKDKLSNVETLVNNTKTPTISEDGPLFYFTALPMVKGSANQNEIGNSLFPDLLGRIRHQVAMSLKGGEFYISIEPDSMAYSQTEGITEDKLNIVGILYNKDKKRIYIKKKSAKDIGNITKFLEFTTDENDAYEYESPDGLKSKVITHILPDLANNPIYSKKLKELPVEFIELQRIKESYKRGEGFAPILFKATPFETVIYETERNQNKYRSAKEVLKGTVKFEDLELKVAISDMNHIPSGSPYITVNGRNFRLFKGALTSEEQESVFELIRSFHNFSSVDKENVKNFLNMMFAYKGSEYMFGLEQGELLVYIIQKDTKGVSNFIDIVKGSELDEKHVKRLRVNVDSKLVDKNISIPFLKDGKVEYRAESARSFYLDHLTTAQRIIKTTPKPTSSFSNIPIYSIEFHPLTNISTESNPTTPFNPEVYEAKEFFDNNIGFLDSIEDEDSDVLFKILVAITGGDFSFSIDFTTNNSKYVGKEDKIYISEDLLNSPVRLKRVLVHEMVHALTGKWLRSNKTSKEYKRLKEILKEIRPQLSEENQKRIQSAEELLANLNEPDVASVLKSNKVDNKNFFEEILDIVKEILRKLNIGEDLDNSLYTEAVRILVDINNKNKSLLNLEVGDKVTTEEVIKTDSTQAVKKANELVEDALKNLDDIFSYEGDDIFKIAEKEVRDLYKDRKSELEDIVNTLDADFSSLLLKVRDREYLMSFVSGELEFEKFFLYILKYYTKRMEENISDVERLYLQNILDNKAGISEVWKKDSKLFKIKKATRTNKSKEIKDDIDKDKLYDEAEVSDEVVILNEESLEEKDNSIDPEKLEDEAEVTSGARGEDGYKENKTTFTFSEVDEVVKTIMAFLPEVKRNEKDEVIYYDLEIENGLPVIPEHLENKGTVVYVNEETEEGLVSTPKFIEFSTNVFGRTKLNNIIKTWIRLTKRFSNSLSLQEMYEKVSDLDALKLIPEAFLLKSYFPADSVQGPNPDRMVQILTRLEASFRKYENDLVIALEYSTKGEDDQTTTKVSIVEEGKDLYLKAYKLHDTYLNILLKLNEDLAQYTVNDKFYILSFLQDSGIFNEKLYGANNEKAVVEFLEKLGLNYHEETKNNPEFLTAANNFIAKLSEKVKKQLDSKLPTKDYSVSVKSIIEFGDLKGFYGKMNAIENRIYPFSDSIMESNAEGEKASTYSLSNAIVLDAAKYNKYNYETIKSKVPRSKNNMFKRSLIYKTLYNKEGERTSNNLTIVNWNGYKKTMEDAASTGNININTTEEQYITYNFVGLYQKGMIENTRAQVSPTSLAYSVGTWTVDFGFIYNRLTPVEITDFSGFVDPTGNINLNANPDALLPKIFLEYLKAEIENGDFHYYTFLTEEYEKKKYRPTELGERLLKENPEDISADLKTEFLDLLSSYLNDEFINTKALLTNVADLRELFRVQDLKYEQAYHNDYIWNFLVNSIVIHTEEVIMFHGDFSNFPSKYFKRSNTPQSTKIPISNNPAVIDYINEELAKPMGSFGSTLFNDSIELGETYDTAVLNDLILDLSVPEVKGQPSKLDIMIEGVRQSLDKAREQDPEIITITNEQVPKVLAAFKKAVVSDGGAVGNPDFYYAILKASGKFGPNHKKAFRALIYDSIHNKEKYFGDKVEELGLKDVVLTADQIKEMKEGLKIIESGKVIFPTIKWSYRGSLVSDDPVVREALDKFAVFPLFPQYTYDKPELHAILLSMIKDKLGYVTYESGTKLVIKDSEKTSLEVKDGYINFEESRRKHVTDYFGEQVATPLYAKTENTFGSQFRKLVISALVKKDGTDLLLDGETEPGEFKKQWADLVDNLSDEIFKEVLGGYGIVKTIQGWNFDNLQTEKLIFSIIKQARLRNMTSVTIDYFESLFEDNKLIHDRVKMEASLNQKEVQNLIANLVKDIAIQKVSGAQMIQVSSASQPLANGKYLGFYEYFSGGVKAAECKVSMNSNFKRLFNLPEVNERITELGGNNLSIIEKTHILNQFLLDDAFVQKYEKELTIVGYRIPTQGYNSMDVLVIREFLPIFQSPQIVLPAEIVVKSGTDYDYDKLSVILPQLDKTGRLYVRDEINTIEDTATLKKRLNILEKELKSTEEAKLEYENNKKLKKLDYDSKIEKIKIDINNTKLLLQRTSSYQDPKALKYIIQNEMIQTSKNLLLNPVNFHRLVTPNSTDLLVDPLRRVLFNVQNEQDDNIRGINITTPYTNYLKWLAANKKSLLSIAAVNNTLTSLIQNHKIVANRKYFQVVNRTKNISVTRTIMPLFLDSDYRTSLKQKEGGVEVYKVFSPVNESKVLKMELLSQVINLTVDMSSDDIIGYSNFDKSDFGAAVYLMTWLGYDWGKLLNIFHQPVIYRFKNTVKYFSKRIDSFAEVKIRAFNALEEELGIQVTEKSFESIREKKSLYSTSDYFTDFLYPGIDNFIKKNFELEGQELEDFLLNAFDSKYKPAKDWILTDLDEEAFKKTQMLVLSFYINSLNESENTRLLSSSINFDSAPATILTKVIDRSVNRARLIQSRFMSRAQIDDLYYNSVISPLNTDDILSGIGEILYPVMFHPSFKIIVSRFSNITPDKNMLYSRIATDLFTAVLHTFGEIKVDEKLVKIAEIGKQYLEENKASEIKDRMVKFQKKMNAQGRNFSILDKLLVSSSSRRFPKIYNLELFLGFQNTTEDKNILTENIKEIYESNREGKELLRDILIIGLTQAPFQRNFFHFVNLFPVNLVSPFLLNAVKKFTSLNENEKQIFFKRFGENFEKNESKLTGAYREITKERHRFKDGQLDLSTSMFKKKTSPAESIDPIVPLLEPSEEYINVERDSKGNAYPKTITNSNFIFRTEDLIKFAELESVQIISRSDKEFAGLYKKHESILSFYNDYVYENEAYVLKESIEFLSKNSEFANILMVAYENFKDNYNTTYQDFAKKLLEENNLNTDITEVEEVSEIQGEEISSYSDNLAFALTNPTHTSPTGKTWSRTWSEGQKKWRDYLSKGIEFEGTVYKDVEEAYQKNKNKYPIGDSRNEFMKNLIKIKLQTYPKLVEGIEAKGGLQYILNSTHQPTAQNSYWETGGKNGFIRMLAQAYEEVSEGGPAQEQTIETESTISSKERIKKVIPDNIKLETINSSIPSTKLQEIINTEYEIKDLPYLGRTDYLERISNLLGDAVSTYAENMIIEIPKEEAQWFKSLGKELSNDFVTDYLEAEASEGMTLKEYAQYLIDKNTKTIDTAQLLLFEDPAEESTEECSFT